MRFGIGKWLVTIVSLILAALAILPKFKITVPYAGDVVAKTGGEFWLLVIAYLLLLFANFIGRRL